MREGQGLGQFQHDLRRPAEIGRAGLDHFFQRLPADVLGHDVVGIAVLAEVVDGHDVRVVQFGGRHGLAFEPREGPRADPRFRGGRP